MAEADPWIIGVGLFFALLYPIFSSSLFSFSIRYFTENYSTGHHAYAQEVLPRINYIIMGALVIVAVPMYMLTMATGLPGVLRLLPAGGLFEASAWILGAFVLGAASYVFASWYRKWYARNYGRQAEAQSESRDAEAGDEGGRDTPSGSEGQAARGDPGDDRYVPGVTQRKMTSLYHMTKPSAMPALVLTNVLEEFIWRGFVFNALLFYQLPVALAILVSGFGFGLLMHLSWGPREISVHTILGIVFGTVYWVSGGALLIPIVAHSSYNLFLSRALWNAWSTGREVAETG